MVNAVRVDEEKSQSWVIAAEALILGAMAGYYIHNNAGAHPALSIVLGIAITALIYWLLVYVNVVFWIWTLGLAAFSSYYIYNSLRESATDTGWSLLWAAVVAFVIIGIHATSRLHNIVENTPNRITRLK